MAKKWVYLFTEVEDAEKYVNGSWDAVRSLLGGKGANLFEMTRIKLPVPPGFTVTTEACNAYLAAGEKFPEGMWDQELAALKAIEKTTGKGFGDAENPLLVSCRSGAKESMPGMMDTVLNIGLTDVTVEGLAALTQNPRFAWDAYRRLIEGFGKVVLDIPDTAFEHALDGMKEKVGAKLDVDLTTENLKALAGEYKAIVKKHKGFDFPQNPIEQLRLATEAVFKSWNGKRAFDYRNHEGIPHNLGTAVNIVTMVFGNMGNTSGTGVAFTRNPSTGEKAVYGEYLINAQGEDVVAGIRTPQKVAVMGEELPEAYEQFMDICAILEKHYRNMQDVEFTIERGKLWMLQTRNGKRTAASAIKIAVDMANEGLITKQEAVMRVTPDNVNSLLHPQFDPAAKKAAAKEGKLLGKGVNASPGAAVGKAYFDADLAEEKAKEGPVVMVRPFTKPDDVHGMIAAKGILTSEGGATSHAAVVARQFGKPCVVGAAQHQDRHGSPHDDRRRRHRQGRRLDQRGRRHRRGVRRPDPDRRAEVRGADRPDHPAELGRRDRRRAGQPRGGPEQLADPRPAGVGQRRLPGRRPPRPHLRRPRHRPVPHRAHVLRGRAPAHRAAHDPGQDQRGAHRGPERAAAVSAQRLRRPVRGDDRPARHHPPDRPAAARVHAGRREAAGRGHRDAGQGRDRRAWPRRKPC